MARDLELTWVEKLKQWRKRRKVNGKSKAFYLGAGASKHDRVSYGRALAKWREIEKELDFLDEGAELQQKYHAWRDQLAARPDIDPSIYFAATVPPTRPDRPLHVSMQRWLDGTARVGEDRSANLNAVRPATEPTKTLGQCIDDYIDYQRGRYEHGLRFPTAPQQERISGVRFMSYRFNALVIKADWDEDSIPQDEATLAALMKRFRESQKTLMTAGKIAPGTVNERMKTMRHVVR